MNKKIHLPGDLGKQYQVPSGFMEELIEAIGNGIFVNPTWEKKLIDTITENMPPAALTSQPTDPYTIPPDFTYMGMAIRPRKWIPLNQIWLVSRNKIVIMNIQEPPETEEP